MITFRPVMVGIAATMITLMISACGGRRYDPAMATRPYPDELGQSEIIQAQVFRKGPNVTIVNARRGTYSHRVQRHSLAITR